MKKVIGASVYDGLCSTIGNQIKQLLADDTINSQLEFARLTVKCRSLGTNTYIAVGTNARNLRFTAALQSITYEAPIINGSVIPFLADSMTCIGDVAGGAGVLEITGIRVYREK